jgi:hypothetical protein
MSAENVQIVRRAYEHFRETGEPAGHLMSPDLVWDMSTFRDWPERQTHEGIEGTREFLGDWVSAWEFQSFPGPFEYHMKDPHGNEFGLWQVDESAPAQ